MLGSVWLRAIVLAIVLVSTSPALAFDDRLRMDPALRIADLASADGSIYLFRYINRPYIPGFQGIVTRHTGRISYAINPLPYVNGAEFGVVDPSRDFSAEAHMLVAKQNLDEKLEFISRDATAFLHRAPLSASTPIGLFGIQFEVEVKPDAENVVAVVPIAHFRDLTKSARDINSKRDYLEFLRSLASALPGLRRAMDLGR